MPLHDRQLEMRLPLVLRVIAELQSCDATSTRSGSAGSRHDPHKAPGRPGDVASQFGFNSSETREDPPSRRAEGRLLSLFALVPSFSAPTFILSREGGAHHHPRKAPQVRIDSQSRIEVMSVHHTEAHVPAKGFGRGRARTEVTCANVQVLERLAASHCQYPDLDLSSLLPFTSSSLSITLLPSLVTQYLLRYVLSFMIPADQHKPPPSRLSLATLQVFGLESGLI